MLIRKGWFMTCVVVFTIGVEVMQWEPIIKLDSDVGNIFLLGRKSNNDYWEFKTKVDFIRSDPQINEFEITLKGSYEVVDCNINSSSLIVGDWKEVISLLNRHNWKDKIPSIIHEDFRGKIWNEIYYSSISIEQKLRWLSVCYPNFHHFSELFSDFCTSNYTVVLTGDMFTSQSDDEDDHSQIWKYVDKKTISTLNTLEKDYSIFQQYYIHLVKKLTMMEDALDQEFLLLKQLQQSSLIHSVITERVDGQHEVSGKNIHPLHGSLSHFYCHECLAKTSKDMFISRRDCFECGGKLRPAIVLVGEKIKVKHIQNAISEIKKADLVLCLGINPNLSTFKRIIANASGKTCLIGENYSPKETKSFHYYISEKPKTILESMCMLFP
jgi:NAD-dependent deacetylase